MEGGVAQTLLGKVLAVTFLVSPKEWVTILKAPCSFRILWKKMALDRYVE